MGGFLRFSAQFIDAKRLQLKLKQFAEGKQKKFLMKGLGKAAKDVRMKVRSNMKSSNKRGTGASASGVKSVKIRRARDKTVFGWRVASATRAHILSKFKGDGVSARSLFFNFDKALSKDLADVQQRNIKA